MEKQTLLWSLKSESKNTHVSCHYYRSIRGFDNPYIPCGYLICSGIEVDESGPGVTYYVIAAVSMIFIILFFPFSLLYTVKV